MIRPEWADDTLVFGVLKFTELSLMRLALWTFRDLVENQVGIRRCRRNHRRTG